MCFGSSVFISTSLWRSVVSCFDKGRTFSHSAARRPPFWVSPSLLRRHIVEGLAVRESPHLLSPTSGFVGGITQFIGHWTPLL